MCQTPKHQTQNTKHQKGKNMPRRLTDELNELIIQDNISGSEIVLSYRMPTTAERAAYANESFRRKGNKVETRVVESRQKYGLKVLAGIREGDFIVNPSGLEKKLSSDPSSANFDPQWKDIVAHHAGDILELLAAHVFDGSVSVGAAAGRDEEADPADGEDLEKNSPATSAR
jgi:hypothetical protein